MQKEFVEYELALRLKALGFDEPCLAIHSNANPKTGLYTLNKYRLKLIKQGSQKDKGVKAPTYSQAFRWFREKYGYYYEIFVDDDKTFGFLISYFVEIGRGDKPIQRKYETYEEAELACLEKLLEIVEFKKE